MSFSHTDIHWPSWHLDVPAHSLCLFLCLGFLSSISYLSAWLYHCLGIWLLTFTKTVRQLFLLSALWAVVLLCEVCHHQHLFWACGDADCGGPLTSWLRNAGGGARESLQPVTLMCWSWRVTALWDLIQGSPYSKHSVKAYLLFNMWITVIAIDYFVYHYSYHLLNTYSVLALNQVLSHMLSHPQTLCKIGGGVSHFRWEGRLWGVRELTNSPRLHSW